MRRVDTTWVCDSCNKTTVTLPGTVSDSTYPAGWALLEWKHSLGTSSDMLCNFCVSKLKTYMTTFSIQNPPVPYPKSEPSNKRRRIALDIKPEPEQPKATAAPQPIYYDEYGGE